MEVPFGIAMRVDGTTRPAPAVRDATKELVAKLAKLDPTEAIDVVVIAEEPLSQRRAAEPRANVDR